MESVYIIGILLFGYLVGSIPFGLLLGRAVGKDVRQEGSGNIGATNVSRLLGKKLGLLTLVADTGKAIVPMLLARWFLNVSQVSASIDLWVVLTGASAFLGHLFPIYLKFKGGKGVATALGVFLLVEPWTVLISLGIFAGVVSTSGYVSLGSITAAALLPIWVWLIGHSTLNTALALFAALFIWIKHYSNIVRLMKGGEKSWKKD